jgi:hypothetical protein
LNEAATKAEEKASDGREDIEEVFSPTVDASEPQDNEPDPNEMTDNTPEARVKVTYYSE